MKVLSVDGATGRVNSGGIELDIGLDLVEGVRVGDYVIVHAGYAISQLSEEEARETLDILSRIELAGEQP